MKTTLKTNRSCMLDFVMLILILTVSIQLQAQNNNSETGKLSSHTFHTPSGTVTIHLPANLYSGDVISGRVKSEPKGNNDNKRARNREILNGYVIEINGGKELLSDIVHFSVPGTEDPGQLVLVLKDAKGSVLSELNLPFTEAPFGFPENAFNYLPPVLPEYIVAGSNVSIPGAFDGNFDNTHITIGEHETDILAESTREVFIKCPDNVSGVKEISIHENDQSFVDEINVLDLRLTASKTQLKTGEQTTINIELTGLDGVSSDVTLSADNVSPGILILEGGNHQNMVITPGMASDDGIWRGKIDGRSIKTGTFSVTVKVEQEPQHYIMPLYPLGQVPQGVPIQFHWHPENISEDVGYELVIRQVVDEAGKRIKLLHKITGIRENPFPFPDTVPPLDPEQIYTWQVSTKTPSGLVSSISMPWQFGPLPPEEIPNGPGDPCEDPEYVKKEENECADIIRYEYEVPLNSVNEDFNTFKDDWKDYFRMLSNTMLQFELQLSMIKYWIGEGDKIDQQAQQVQKLAGLVKKGIGKGVKTFKEGGEEVMKDMAKEFAEDQVKSFEQYAVNQVSETLGALYDLEDLAIRQIGLGIAKGITGVYPDKMADSYRRQLQITTAELATWVSHRANYNSGANHPTLQDGINDMCDMLNQLDQIERDFEKAVEEAGFICIECEIPDDLLEMMHKLRQDIETHIRMFGDTIDQIRQRLVEARGIMNNKKAYEDIARLGSFQSNSAKQTGEINRVLEESKTEFENALNTRKQ